MKGVILAGGLGTRLHPVTLETPKPLLTVKRKPIINYLVDSFCRHGINEPIVLINKQHQHDYEWWRRRYQSSLPEKLELKVETKPLGTFGGLKALRRQLTQTFLLSNGDELKDFDLSALIDFHRRQKLAATIALVKVANPRDYGVPVMKGNKIKKFLEKPETPPANFISSGLYVLEPEVFDYADWKRGFLMIEKDIFPRLAAAGQLAGCKIKNGRWYDCGTFERWEKAIREW